MRRVTLGRVAGVFGVRGWLRVHSYTRPKENLLDYRRWWIDHHEGFEATVVEARPHGEGLVAQITDAAGAVVVDRDIAASLIDAEIQVERSAMPEPPPGQVYWFDLVGLRVVNEQGMELGRIDSMMSNGPQDVMILKAQDAERLIPFVRGPIVKRVDLEQGLVVADWQPDY